MDKASIEPVKRKRRKLIADCGAYRIVAELCDSERDNRQPELFIFLESKKTGNWQDICAIRPESIPTHENVHPASPKRVECLVWSDENDESYTHRFAIPVDVLAEELLEEARKS